jgi:hypothetical protein
MAAIVFAMSYSTPNNQTYAHVLNLCEVYYDFYRSDGPETALQDPRPRV